MKLRLVGPGLAASHTAARPAARIGDLRGIHIGLLANGKANGDRLLEAVGAHFSHHHGAVVHPIVSKPHASLPATHDVLSTFQAEVAVVLTAVGD